MLCYWYHNTRFRAVALAIRMESQQSPVKSRATAKQRLLPAAEICGASTEVTRKVFL